MQFHTLTKALQKIASRFDDAYVNLEDVTEEEKQENQPCIEVVRFGQKATCGCDPSTTLDQVLQSECQAAGLDFSCVPLSCLELDVACVYTPLNAELAAVFDDVAITAPEGPGWKKTYFYPFMWERTRASTWTHQAGDGVPIIKTKRYYPNFKYIRPGKDNGEIQFINMMSVLTARILDPIGGNYEQYRKILKEHADLINTMKLISVTHFKLPFTARVEHTIDVAEWQGREETPLASIFWRETDVQPVKTIHTSCFKAVYDAVIDLLDATQVVPSSFFLQLF